MIDYQFTSLWQERFVLISGAVWMDAGINLQAVKLRSVGWCCWSVPETPTYSVQTSEYPPLPTKSDSMYWYYTSAEAWEWSRSWDHLSGVHVRACPIIINPCHRAFPRMGFRSYWNNRFLFSFADDNSSLFYDFENEKKKKHPTPLAVKLCIIYYTFSCWAAHLSHFVSCCCLETFKFTDFVSR